MASFGLARQAALAAAGPQHHPAGTLYVVATPIGNLADMSLRALHVLGLVDALACEDTRHTQSLLRGCALERPGLTLLALHQHNEAEAAQAVIARLQAGQRVGLVSDAGTPAISDPGARLVALVQAAGLRVIPIPGASSVTTLLSAAGCVPAGAAPGGFVFVGFLPARGQERERALQALAAEARAQVLLEAPHRMAALAQSLALLGPRRVTVGRELTKQFEQIHTLAAAELPAWLAERSEHGRGEFALVLHEAPAAPAVDADPHAPLLRLLLQELPLKTAVRLAAEITGAPRNALYAQALALRQAGEDEDADTAGA